MSNDLKAIKYGTPFIYVDIAPHEEIILDKENDPIASSDKFLLTQILLEHQGKIFKIWVSDNRGADNKLLRSLRLSVLRIDLAVQCLGKLFKEIIHQNIDPIRGSRESQYLQKFLLNNYKRILKVPKRLKDIDDSIIEKAKEVYDKINPGQRIMLREKLEQDLDIRRSISHMVKAYTDTITSADNFTKNISTKVLFVGANPKNQPNRSIDKEFEDIKQAIIGGKNSKDIELLNPVLSTTIDNLTRSILNESPNIVHFAGHGETKGIYLEDEQRNLLIAKGAALDQFFNSFSESIECVVLNSDFSDAQAKSIAKYIKYVIGMKKDILPEAAITFAKGFYMTIASGREIPFAFDIAKNQLELYDLPDSATPKLYSLTQ